MRPFVEGTVCIPGAHRVPPVWLRPEGHPTPTPGESQQAQNTVPSSWELRMR